MIVKCMGDLNDAYGFVLEETKSPNKKISLRDEVGVEYGEVFGGDVFERVIDVSCFGMRIIGAGDIANTPFDAERFEPGATAVVEHPNGEVRIIETECADDGFFDNFDWFVVTRDENVDPWQAISRHGPQPCLMAISLRPPVACAQEGNVQNEGITHCKDFCGEAKPNP